MNIKDPLGNPNQEDINREGEKLTTRRLEAELNQNPKKKFNTRKTKKIEEQEKRGQEITGRTNYTYFPSGYH